MLNQRTSKGAKSQSQFSMLPNVETPRSVFDRSSTLKTTLNGGDLVPVFVDEALPGDTFKMSPSIFGRLSTPLHALMDQLILEAFFFAVPMRLIFDNFERMMGAQDNPNDSTDFIIPTMTSPTGGYAIGSLSDYFGIPTGVEGLEHSALYHRAYNFIYNEWFRDENLQDSVPFTKDDGPDSPADYALLKRGKRKDYFSSSLPWPQKGTAVDIPLGATAPVTGNAQATGGVAFSMIPQGGINPTAGVARVDTNNQNMFTDATNAGGATTPPLEFTNLGNVELINAVADLSTASTVTINELRTAFQMQKLLERDARGGTRYVEMIQAHFGVTSPDFRLQRPELLGTMATHLMMEVVPSTVTLSPASGLGTTGAYGVFAHNGRGWVKSFTEHCLILGMVSVRAPLTYQQGLHRRFSRSTKWDFYFPSLAHLGEQAVLNKEIYADPAGGTDDDVWGYQGRFDEYRYGQNIVTGQMRSAAATSLDPWHLALDFDQLPTLGPDFIQDDPPINRVVALSSDLDDQPNILLDASFNLKCVRPMPTYGIPGLVDHF